MLSLGVASAMVALQFIQVTVSTISKAAMTKGMSQYVYIAYSNVLSLLILLPLTLCYYRKRDRPTLTGSMICRIFLMSLLGSCTEVLLNLGIKKGSPTLASAMGDLIPASTFLFAIIFRMENLDLRFPSSWAKIIGTMVSIAGALTLTLYKGQAIIGALSTDTSQDALPKSHSNWIIGCAFSASGAFCVALVFIIQTWIIKEYRAELMVTLISGIFGTILTTIFSLIVERDPNSWILKPDIELVAIGSMALLSGVRKLVSIWACGKKGPVYTALFSPLGMVIAMALGVSFLGDTLYVGSIIGGLIIGFGFYAVIWGKAKEQNMARDVKDGSHSESLTHKVPLLQNKTIDV